MKKQILQHIANFVSVQVSKTLWNWSRVWLELRAESDLSVNCLVKVEPDSVSRLCQSAGPVQSWPPSWRLLSIFTWKSTFHADNLKHPSYPALGITPELSQQSLLVTSSSSQTEENDQQNPLTDIMMCRPETCSNKIGTELITCLCYK